MRGLLALLFLYANYAHFVTGNRRRDYIDSLEDEVSRLKYESNPMNQARDLIHGALKAVVPPPYSSAERLKREIARDMEHQMRNNIKRDIVKEVEKDMRKDMKRDIKRDIRKQISDPSRIPSYSNRYPSKIADRIIDNIKDEVYGSRRPYRYLEQIEEASAAEVAEESLVPTHEERQLGNLMEGEYRATPKIDQSQKITEQPKRRLQFPKQNDTLSRRRKDRTKNSVEEDTKDYAIDYTVVRANSEGGTIQEKITYQNNVLTEPLREEEEISENGLSEVGGVSAELTGGEKIKQKKKRDRTRKLNGGPAIIENVEKDLKEETETHSGSRRLGTSEGKPEEFVGQREDEKESGSIEEEEISEDRSDQQSRKEEQGSILGDKEEYEKFEENYDTTYEPDEEEASDDSNGAVYRDNFEKGKTQKVHDEDPVLRSSEEVHTSYEDDEEEEDTSFSVEVRLLGESEETESVEEFDEKPEFVDGEFETFQEPLKFEEGEELVGTGLEEFEQERNLEEQVPETTGEETTAENMAPEESLEPSARRLIGLDREAARAAVMQNLADVRSRLPAKARRLAYKSGLSLVETELASRPAKLKAIIAEEQERARESNKRKSVGIEQNESGSFQAQVRRRLEGETAAEEEIEEIEEKKANKDRNVVRRLDAKSYKMLLREYEDLIKKSTTRALQGKKAKKQELQGEETRAPIVEAARRRVVSPSSSSLQESSVVFTEVEKDIAIELEVPKEDEPTSKLTISAPHESTDHTSTHIDSTYAEEPTSVTNEGDESSLSDTQSAVEGTPVFSEVATDPDAVSTPAEKVQTRQVISSLPKEEESHDVMRDNAEVQQAIGDRHQSGTEKDEAEKKNRRLQGLTEKGTDKLRSLSHYDLPSGLAAVRANEWLQAKGPPSAYDHYLYDPIDEPYTPRPEISTMTFTKRPTSRDRKYRVGTSVAPHYGGNLYEIEQGKRIIQPGVQVLPFDEISHRRIDKLEEKISNLEAPEVREEKKVYTPTWLKNTLLKRITQAGDDVKSLSHRIIDGPEWVDQFLRYEERRLTEGSSHQESADIQEGADEAVREAKSHDGEEELGSFEKLAQKELARNASPTQYHAGAPFILARGSRGQQTPTIRAEQALRQASVSNLDSSNKEAIDLPEETLASEEGGNEDEITAASYNPYDIQYGPRRLEVEPAAGAPRNKLVSEGATTIEEENLSNKEEEEIPEGKEEPAVLLEVTQVESTPRNLLRYNVSRSANISNPDIPNPDISTSLDSKPLRYRSGMFVIEPTNARSVSDRPSANINFRSAGDNESGSSGYYSETSILKSSHLPSPSDKQHVRRLQLTGDAGSELFLWVFLIGLPIACLFVGVGFFIYYKRKAKKEEEIDHLAEVQETREALDIAQQLDASKKKKKLKKKKTETSNP